MKAFLICSCLFILYFTGTGQAQAPITVYDAELSFAGKAREANTKTAFLAYLDSTGVVFNNGRVLNGIKAWQRAPEEGPRLLWKPAMSLMSTDRELGFTTGPFEVRQPASDSVLACGQYSTVWKKNSSGEWKVLADLGTAYTVTAYPAQELVTPAVQLLPDTLTDIHKLEIDFNKEFRSTGVIAFHSRITSYSILNKDGQQPFQAKEELLHQLSGFSETTEIIPVGWGIARSRDLAYVYGQMKHEGKTENYLRVWGHTIDGWVLLLQVMKF